jgi:hypothetical protein
MPVVVRQFGRPCAKRLLGVGPAERRAFSGYAASPAFDDFFFFQKKMTPRTAAMKADFLFRNLMRAPFVGRRLTRSGAAR